MFIPSRLLKSVLQAGKALGIVAASSWAPAYAIVGNDAYSPSDLVDTTNITGVGQMIIDQQNGYLGLCTATLINPRTVIFAAHCVNENGDHTDFRDASAYGVAHGGTPIAFLFNANNNASDNSAIGNWFWGVDDGARYLTRPADHAYNSNYVVYDTRSTVLGLDSNYLQADVALAALDTPATDIPTWTLLFSPLTGPTHATITGYGINGTGTLGDAYGIDYRRRSAENMISVLDSYDDLDRVLFGAGTGLPQNLYQLDFNDPLYGTSKANEYDFNIFYDAALPREGITAGGDSGGPLIVDQAFSQQVIAAVLSGGQRFMTDQPSSSYGTTSFYQPLYLFWDWIVANNPYKYVSAKAGDGSWTDPSHWVMDIDPNYVTIGADGTLVNALPTAAAEGVPSEGGVNTPKFGLICIYDDCVDLGSAFGGGTAATVIDGPGTTNFVPADSDGDATHAPRYYDVTLSAAGTTTLSNAAIVIDRLTINGAKTGLTIASNGSLGVLIDTTMYAGNLRVDGHLISAGDLALMGGVLSGSGTVTAPYTTVVLGAIAPGSLGATGTLSVQGNVVLSSRAGLLIDLDNAASDRLEVTGGTLSLGGTLVVNPVAGSKLKWHQTAVVATGDVIEGAFDSVPDTLAGVLYPVAAKVAGNGFDSEVVMLEAASFLSALTDPTADQALVGGVLDADRAGSYQALAGVYGEVDVLSGAGLGDALNALVPNAARSLPQTAIALTTAHASYLWQYLGGMNPSNEPRFAIQTGALKLAENSQTGSLEMRHLLANLGARDPCSAGVCATDAVPAPLPRGVGAFLSGQKIDASLKVGGNGGKADLDGYLIALGADMAVSGSVRLGLSFGFGDADTSLRDQPARTKTSSRQVLAYGMYENRDGYFANGFAGIGWQSFHIARQAVIGEAHFALDGRASAQSPLFGVQAGRAFAEVAGGTFKPAIGFQYGRVHVDGFSETGGEAALSVLGYSRQSATLRAGFDSDWKVDVSGLVLKPQLHAFLVGRLGKPDGKISAGLAAAPGTTAAYDLAGDSPVWADLGLRLDAELADNASLGFDVTANPGNAGGTYTAFGGSLRLTF